MNMETVLMAGKSHHGKNRIAETRKRFHRWDGKTWRVKIKRQTLVARSVDGPWALVEPDTDENTDWVSRWVNLREDDDFTITPNVKLNARSVRPVAVEAPVGSGKD